MLIHSDNGIISIRHDGVIKGICDDRFNAHAAATACNSLYGVTDVVSYNLI